MAVGNLNWRKASYSSDNGNCVEMAAMPDGNVAVRDTKNRAGDTLVFSRAEMRAWINGVRAGEFDDLV